MRVRAAVDGQVVEWTALAPTRALDSRLSTGAWGSPLVSGTTRTLAVQGVSVPVEADAVIANTTVTGSTADSFVTVFPDS